MAKGLNLIVGFFVFFWQSPMERGVALQVLPLLFMHVHNKGVDMFDEETYFQHSSPILHCPGVAAYCSKVHEVLFQTSYIVYLFNTLKHK